MQHMPNNTSAAGLYVERHELCRGGIHVVQHAHVSSILGQNVTICILLGQLHRYHELITRYNNHIVECAMLKWRMVKCGHHLL